MRDFYNYLKNNIVKKAPEKTGAQLCENFIYYLTTASCIFLSHDVLSSNW